MTDELGKRFADLRRDTLGEIVAPGAPKVRSTVRRRRGAAVSAGAGFVVAAMLLGAGLGTRPDAGGDYSAGSPAEASSSGGPPVMPEPTGSELDPVRAAGGLLADRSKTPTSINATNGVVYPDYENHLNDMPADTYRFRFFCVGAGTVGVVVKQGNSGDTVLGAGNATCAAGHPAPLELEIHQPSYGYLRVFASGDARSNGRAGFAFEFLSETGRTGFGPSGPPYSFSPSPSN
ncbi:hypothetical protein GCM10010172_39070 [Paractinoplanes ferrugineus]|uniref:Uncharacterized protein n=1 Tax=Paractinoplanes ferrugineus TaxID=113564 RepID=A0A919J2F5_9ACTN|nr:hypothetical protein [Actinoplanes ferrugineus]GIE12683.1 hypothetical protein Afe05nite_45230 [Actinoplanes ferrugineus]